MTEPTRQAAAAQNRSGKLTVLGKLKTAVDLMLYEGSRTADAAMAAGTTDYGLREPICFAEARSWIANTLGDGRGIGGEKSKTDTGAPTAMGLIRRFFLLAPEISAEIVKTTEKL
ncbi:MULTISPECIES: hypothetical protein [Bradyrhizobium]|uniref:hypothetical protein n=1 Tax=Bradyrhizobium TaxID=374 RepID=UPI0010089488|nr:MULTISPECIES: hypothetical protein [Bradyrhizobium]